MSRSRVVARQEACPKTLQPKQVSRRGLGTARAHPGSGSRVRALWGGGFRASTGFCLCGGAEEPVHPLPSLPALSQAGGPTPEAQGRGAEENQRPPPICSSQASLYVKSLAGILKFVFL